MMFIVFGPGKCPLCGDFGTTVEPEIYHCTRCSISFNDFYISKYSEANVDENKFWN